MIIWFEVINKITIHIYIPFECIKTDIGTRCRSNKESLQMSLGHAKEALKG